MLEVVVLYCIVPVALAAFLFGARLIWLVYCAWIAHDQPTRAAEIIESSGKWAPKSLPSLPWGKGP
ncbi:hypothetical protein [Mycobacterium numidiamassiliense]|uniref:hypothetical protein n=1 Tax=Mycobacterium numidiamassiliense TaxID=1841861 RepID=UPI001055FF66|nr:hypothetical protein [Mycobacterium numidiamassiliense]